MRGRGGEMHSTYARYVLQILLGVTDAYVTNHACMVVWIWNYSWSMYVAYPGAGCSHHTHITVMSTSPSCRAARERANILSRHVSSRHNMIDASCQQQQYWNSCMRASLPTQYIWDHGYTEHVVSRLATIECYIHATLRKLQKWEGLAMCHCYMITCRSISLQNYRSA